MATVQPNSTPVGNTRIRPVANTSAGRILINVGAAEAFTQKRVLISATPRRSLVAQIIGAATQDQVGSGLAVGYAVRREIRTFPGEPYVVRRPISVLVERTADEDYLATIDDANIASSGSTFKEAFQNLNIEILNLFEKFTEEENNLGPEPARQLKVLRAHIARTR